MKDVVLRALRFLNASEKRGFALILFLAAIAAILQIISVLSIMPFIMLLSNPELIETNQYLQAAYQKFGFESFSQFLLAFGVLGVLMLTIGNGFLAFENWLSYRYINRLALRLKKQMLERVLHQPFEFFLGHHSGELSNVILEQVDRIVGGIISTFIVFFSSLALTIAIGLILMLVSWQTTLITLVFLMVLYLLVFVALRRSIEYHGRRLTELSSKIYSAIKESLEGVKEIKTRRAEEFFANKFSEPGMKMTDLNVRFNLLNTLPSFILETAIFAGLVAISMYFILSGDDGGYSLSFIALYGLAIYRLAPALKSVFGSVAEIHHSEDALRIVESYGKIPTKPDEGSNPISFSENLTISNLSYRYPKTDSDQLQNITATITRGSSVCLFGHSGSGKSTLINILAGLITPTGGNLLSDNNAIHKTNINSWRDQIGFLPQQIYLVDDTIASNIAFGQQRDQIDLERVIEVSKIANIHDFVNSELPKAYDTVVGENGASLSGGQRQRIGIARSLYHDPDILIYDESFSGLDEKNRMEILDRLLALENKTIILSSHEKDVAARCQHLLNFESGKLTQQ